MLATLHFYDGKPDGKTGPATRRAIRDFQKTAGLRQTGEVSRELYDALRELAPNPAAPAGN